MTPERAKKLQTVLAKRRQGIMVLEDIHDPHNAAAIMRSCDAFGIYKVCFIFEKEKRYNPRRIGKISSASANKWLEIEVYSSTKNCLSKLRRQGYEVFATALDAKAKDLSKADLSKPKTALMVGNEHRGLSEIALKLADETIYIPMQGMVQSLNVSVSAALCAYEMYRQQTKKKLKNRLFLGKIDQNRLAKSWGL